MILDIGTSSLTFCLPYSSSKLDNNHCTCTSLYKLSMYVPLSLIFHIPQSALDLHTFAVYHDSDPLFILPSKIGVIQSLCMDIEYMGNGICPIHIS